MLAGLVASNSDGGWPRDNFDLAPSVQWQSGIPPKPYSVNLRDLDKLGYRSSSPFPV